MTPQVFSGLLLIAGCLWMAPHGDFTDSTVFRPFWMGYGLLGVGFALSWTIRTLTPLHFWAIALLCRGILLCMHPGDDIWRYLWEGMIQTHGFSPYHVAPDAPMLEALRTDWWNLINHPSVSAIYPPLTQWGFRLLAAIAPSVWLFKCAFVAADVATCTLLVRRYGHRRAIDYGWNPIILYSFAGGGHYDSWFLLALVAAWLSFDAEPGSPHVSSSAHVPPSTQSVLVTWRGRNADGRSLSAYAWSAFWVGVSVAFKWISLPILGFLAWRGLRQGRWLVVPLVVLLGSLPMILTSLAFCDGMACPLVPTRSVFVSYGRSAELIPYLLAQTWEASRWENQLFAIPLGLWVGWLMVRSPSFLQFSEWYLFGVFVLSPITHAWYFTWIVPFAVSSRNWGTRFLSLSAIVYFVLPYRQSIRDFSWFLRPLERVALWAPFLAGWLGHVAMQQRLHSSSSDSASNSYATPR
jgi:hypothetical protein